jgi:hypothetical protein
MTQGIIPQPAESEAVEPINAQEVQTIVGRLRMGAADYLPIGLAHTAADMIVRLHALLLEEVSKKRR